MPRERSACGWRERLISVEDEAVKPVAWEQEVKAGSMVPIPPGEVHVAEGRMRVLVVGILDVADDDYFDGSGILGQASGV